jgi:hypothetical protein
MPSMPNMARPAGRGGVDRLRMDVKPGAVVALSNLQSEALSMVLSEAPSIPASVPTPELPLRFE